jgi:hypothetical protein
MAITQPIRTKGIDIEQAYIKINFVNFAVDIYAGVEQRASGELLEHRTITVPTNSELYDVLKQYAYPEAKDVDNSWQASAEQDGLKDGDG